MTKGEVLETLKEMFIERFGVNKEVNLCTQKVRLLTIKKPIKNYEGTDFFSKCESELRLQFGEH